MERYFADDAASASEQDRLNRLASIYDPIAQAAFDRVGLRSGMMVAEVGVGSGSMLSWLTQRVGEMGQVVGFDLTDRFVDPALRDTKTLELLTLDVTTQHLPTARFDIVYARLLLEHLPDPRRAIQHMVQGLKQGGCLVAMDFDSSVVGALDASHPRATEFNRASRRIHDAVNDSGLMACDYGLQVGADMAATGLVDVGDEVHRRIERGDSFGAKVSADGMGLLGEALPQLADDVATASSIMRQSDFCYRDVDMHCWTGSKPWSSAGGGTFR